MSYINYVNLKRTFVCFLKMTVYSHSRLEAFSNCPLRYKFLYLDKLTPEGSTIEAFLGSCVHTALEWLYRQVQLTREPQLEEVLNVFFASWQQNYTPDLQIVRPDLTAEDFFKIGKKCLSDYYQTYHPFKSGQIIGLEKLIAIDINGYKLQGYIDRLEKSQDGTYVIHDYKTSQTLPPQAKVDEDRQLALYQIGLKQLWPQIKEVKLVWHYLFFNEELVSSRTPEQLEQLKEEVAAVIKQIEQATEKNSFQPLETVLCDWCEFQKYCPKRKHLFLVQSLKLEEKATEDGVTLVDKYIALLARKRELKKQIDDIDVQLEKLKAAIIKYAYENGLDNVAGSSHLAKVSQEQRVVLPPKGEPKREQLEQLIKTLGLWEQAAELSSYSLKAVLLNGHIDADKVKQLKQLVELETKPKVTFAKLPASVLANSSVIPSDTK